MENKKYYITSEQLSQLKHYQEMFCFEKENLRELCKSEKDDIVYGFQLGETSSNLSRCQIEMMELEDEIKKQVL